MSSVHEENPKVPGGCQPPSPVAPSLGRQPEASELLSQRVTNEDRSQTGKTMTFCHQPELPDHGRCWEEVKGTRCPTEEDGHFFSVVGAVNIKLSLL